MSDERRQGHSKLVYDKEKRTIVTVPNPPMDSIEEVREALISLRHEDQESSPYMCACDECNKERDIILTTFASRIREECAVIAESRLRFIVMPEKTPQQAYETACRDIAVRIRIRSTDLRPRRGEEKP